MRDDRGRIEDCACEAWISRERAARSAGRQRESMQIWQERSEMLLDLMRESVRQERCEIAHCAAAVCVLEHRTPEIAGWHRAQAPARTYLVVSICVCLRQGHTSTAREIISTGRQGGHSRGFDVGSMPSEAVT